MQTIIIIGAGRSGSTVLSRILNAHPRISFHGETDFLVPRLWNEIWENRFWFHWKLQSTSGVSSAVSRMDNTTLYNLRREIDIDVPDDQVHDAQQKAAQSVRQVLKTLFGVIEKGLLAWGFKELWNGSSSFMYDWSTYDYVFPKAVWVHLVRDPFDFARSCSQWTKTTLDLGTLTHFLKEWVKIINFSRLRKDTGRFFEIKFEAVVKSPMSALSDILTTCGIDWDDKCLVPLDHPVMKSEISTSSGDDLELTADQICDICNSVSGFKEICEELGYSVNQGIPNYFKSYDLDIKKPVWITPELNLVVENLNTELQAVQTELEQRKDELQSTGQALEISRNDSQASKQALAATEAELQKAKMRETHLIEVLKKYFVTSSQAVEAKQLEGRFIHEGGLCWSIALHELGQGADDEHHISRSSLILFEDENILQPAHAVHEDIRTLGSGRFSHWMSNLYFSTSDGSDPNTNGRRYTVLFVNTARESNLAARERELTAKEGNLNTCAAELSAREAKLKANEAKLNEHVAETKSHEADLARRQAKLEARETEITTNEAKPDERVAETKKPRS